MVPLHQLSRFGRRQCPPGRGYRSVGRGLVILGLVLLSLVSCEAHRVQSALEVRTMDLAPLTEVNNGQTVKLRVGDRLTIQLPENPSTGYQWALEANPEAVLSLQSSGYQPTATGRVGSGGQHIFVLQAERVGTAQPRFKHWRPWEGDSSISDRFTVTVQVEP